MSYIYIASPFTHDDPEVREDRYNWVLKYTHNLITKGQVAFSPILHCKPLAETGGLPTDFDFWEFYNFAMLLPAKELHILCLDGWINSKGVSAEIRMARMMQKPLRFILWNESLKIFTGST